jgi:enoyl-CoA hydratase/carnithine racemase
MAEHDTTPEPPPEGRILTESRGVVAAGAERDRAIRIATTIAEQAPLAVRASLASSRRFAEFGPIAAAAELDALQQRLSASDDFREGVRSFRERSIAKFQGR